MDDIQRVVLAAPGSKAVAEAQDVLLVDLVEDPLEGVLWGRLRADSRQDQRRMGPSIRQSHSQGQGRADSTAGNVAQIDAASIGEECSQVWWDIFAEHGAEGQEVPFA